jgi:hypothetical protein
MLSAFLLVGLRDWSVCAPLNRRVKNQTTNGFSPHLPLGLMVYGLSILAICMGSEVPAWFLRRVMTTVQCLTPDAIVLTGDFVHSRPDDVNDLWSLFQGCGSYGVWWC